MDAELSQEVQAMVRRASESAHASRHRFVAPEHLLLVLLCENNADALVAWSLDDRARRYAIERLSELMAHHGSVAATEEASPPRTARLIGVLKRAAAGARRSGGNGGATTSELAVALAQAESGVVARILFEARERAMKD